MYSRTVQQLLALQEIDSQFYALQRESRYTWRRAAPEGAHDQKRLQARMSRGRVPSFNSMKDNTELVESPILSIQ